LILINIQPIGADNVEIGKEAAKYIISDSKSEKKL
jgi:hypothetical protein